MDITCLSRSELIEKLTVIYQLSCRYDNNYKKLLSIQNKMVPAKQPRRIAAMEGRSGGVYRVALFMVLFFLIGIIMTLVIESMLPFKNSLINFLIALALTGGAMYWLTGVCMKLINFGIAKINIWLEADAEKRNQEIAQYNRKFEPEMAPYLQNMQAIQRQYNSVGITVPKKYAATSTVGNILELLKDGRADSWAGAVNLYEEELSRGRMESQMRQIREGQNLQYLSAINAQNQMIANQQMTNMLMAWNLSNTLMR